ncbi:MAG TPA: histidinol dehydrogenase [Dokdonella sp.]|uniref:histidinol dehydrogenase n=1 Tax=Dokdonella sp. TaxID=2291710 RepID=UPI002D806A6A|nr:histidinol dehydrogenase [Dokdonella sp.]HET9032629.1 histidinol dehydrogenase [Dokdonella sp.]
MKQLDWNSLDASSRSAALARPAQTNSAETRAAVARTIDAVRNGGDTALLDLTRRYDRCELDSLRVSIEEFDAAEQALSTELKQAIVDAHGRIELFHRACALQSIKVETAPGVVCERILRPIARVGLYVPAGAAPLPSTALMLGVPASIAGCNDVVLCSPPRLDGRCDEAVLFAARLCGIDKVFKLGGAQAIAAMAYATESVPRCDKLFGPGNVWVTEAKVQVAADPRGAAIDMPAGPSEVLVIADAKANPEFVAADLLAQAEHGADSQSILLTPNAALIDEVATRIEAQRQRIPRADIAARSLAHGCLIKVDSLAEAVAISNDYAPEHLIINCEKPRDLLESVSSAGSIFLGAWSPESVGDYCSGTNHVLPTYGAARSWSGLSVASFQKQMTVQELSVNGLRTIGPCAVTLARAEQLDAHAAAVSLRLESMENAA